MKLINTSSLEIESFSGKLPPYAILSHTWGAESEEVTLQEMITKPRTPATKAKWSYMEIVKRC